MRDVRLDLSFEPLPPRRRSWFPFVALGVVGVVVAVALGVAFSPFQADAAKPRLASVDGLTFWSSGDSTSYYMSVALTETLPQLGGVPLQPEPAYENASGLRTPEFFDWESAFADELLPLDPDVVVFMIGANDAQPGLDPVAYREKVARMMHALRRDDRYVVWVGQPNMGEPERAAIVRELNDIFRDEAAGRPWVRYVDTWDATSDADGAYASVLPDENGVDQVIRADDGLHFTPDGGRRLAALVLEELLDIE